VKISPLDIKKQEFAVKFRGYSPDEVHAYLDMISAELEDALRKNLELEQKVASQQERLTSYSRMETVLHETLVTTQKAAEETKLSAERKAEAIIAEANLAAQRITNETNEKLVKIQREIVDLTNQKDSLLMSFRSLLETQLSLLDSMEKRQKSSEEFVPLKKKNDLSDDELEAIVDEFERKLASDKGNNRQADSGPRRNDGH
jgi:cell division initiation protein